MSLFLRWALAGLMLSAASTLHAQQSAEELSQKAANPLANLISVPLQLNNDFKLGQFDREDTRTRRFMRLPRT